MPVDAAKASPFKLTLLAKNKFMVQVGFYINRFALIGGFKQNYFEIFSMPVSTTPDLNILKEKNHQLQQQVHPDRFANSDDAEKREAMQITSLVNEAFNTLKIPVSRLQYMLTLKGVDMDGETDTSIYVKK